MSRFLVTLSLGPVQSLIEAARRTRDLWCGSWLLSECARAAAAALHQQQPGCLIFPCPDPDNPEADLSPRDKPGDEANIANILRAEMALADADAARAACEQASDAARSRLRELSESAREQLRSPPPSLRSEVWQAQIDQQLEVFYAWAQLVEGKNAYTNASSALGGALAARKTSRDYSAATPITTPGLPKSSLDGGFESVLPAWPSEHVSRRKLGLARGEQLDALAVTKRMAGDAEQFTAYSRIAAHHWIASLAQQHQQALNKAYEPLVPLQLATRVSGNQGCYHKLPYDAQLLYRFRLDNAIASLTDQPADKPAQDALDQLRAALSAASRDNAAPVPYACIIKADGDHMGELLSRANSATRSREVSRALHGFACSVRSIVRRHNGHAIYAGGDDVLAIAPLEDAVACCRELAEAFRDQLNSIAEQLGLEAEQHPTLSAGIGIGHLMEPLGGLRTRADRAEKLAKGDGLSSERNALAICLGIRSGGELTWRAQWSDTNAFTALNRFTMAYREQQLPSRIAYDMAAIDRRLAWLPEQGEGNSQDQAEAGGIRQSELQRLLDRARTDAGGEKKILPELRQLILQRAALEPMAQLADSLVIARWLSARTAAELGDRQ